MLYWRTRLADSLNKRTRKEYPVVGAVRRTNCENLMPKRAKTYNQRECSAVRGGAGRKVFFGRMPFSTTLSAARNRGEGMSWLLGLVLVAEVQFKVRR